MSKAEKVINDLNVAKRVLCNPQMLTLEMNIRIGQAITSAIDLLKEQESVVQCKDCKNAEILTGRDNVIYCKKNNYTGVRPDEFYCADGDRR